MQTCLELDNKPASNYLIKMHCQRSNLFAEEARLTQLGQTGNAASLISGPCFRRCYKFVEYSFSLNYIDNMINKTFLHVISLSFLLLFSFNMVFVLFLFLFMYLPSV